MSTCETKINLADLGPLDAKRRYTIPQACAYLNQSRARTYQQIKAGDLPILKDGRRTYIPGCAIIKRSQP